MNKVLLTGLKSTNAKAAAIIATLGHQPLLLPLQEMQPIPQVNINTDAYDWIAFTSTTTVKFFIELGIRPNNCKLAAVGPSTAKELTSYKLNTDLYPNEDYSACGLANAFEKHPPQKILYPCSKIADNTLEKLLSDQGHSVTRHNLYEPVELTTAPLPQFTDVIFFSQSGVELFVKKYGSHSLQNKKAAAIGKSTAAAFESHFAFSPILPKESTVTGVIEALL